MPTYHEYNNDMINAYADVARQEVTPAEALDRVQVRQQKLFDRMYRRCQKVKDTRRQE